MYSEKLASISEYGGDSTTTTTSLAGLSNYSNYTRSPSGESLNTLATTSRSWKNGLPGEKGSNVDDSLSHRIVRGKSLSHKHNYELCKKVRITMALIGILLLVAAIFMLSFYLPQQYGDEDEIYIVPPKKQRIIWDGNMEFDNNNLMFSTNLSEAVLDSETGPEISLKIYLGELIPESVKSATNITFHNDTKAVTMIFTQPNLPDISLEISKNNLSDKCYDIHWQTTGDTVLEDCLDTSAHWFGLGELFHQKWPISKTKFESVPFLTSDFLDNYQPNVFGGVIEPFAVNSKGGGIYIAETVPLHISMNLKAGKFCLQANKTYYESNSHYNGNENKTNVLHYTICIRNNIREVHKVMFDHFIEKPNGVPDKQMMVTPIWSTWVRYKKTINQEKIIEFAKEIRENNFEGSILEIDDQYSTQYGDYDFRLDSFNKAINMLQILKLKKFRVTMWVYPFSNFQSKSFLEGVQKDQVRKKLPPYFVRSGRKSVPGTVKWWNGLGTILDTTNSSAREWFTKKLKDFQILPIDGFKFDAGEVNYLPENYKFSIPLKNPNYYSHYYVQVASQFALSETRVAWRTQKFPILVRILDRSSDWGTRNGLQSVLTTTLTFGILGYPFVLPDFVGGNAYLIEKPRRELYIRWVQLSVFLPAIQFSIPPWDYDMGDSNETTLITQEALSIRKNLSEYIYDLAKNVQITGEPIIRPLWWYWPTDDETFVIESEFMLGQDYLIAPVLNLNVVAHAIYLPAGVWQEQWNMRKTINMTHGGLIYYNVTIHDICYFKLLTNMTSTLK